MTRSNIALTEGGGGKKAATIERTVGGVVVQSQSSFLDEPDLPTYTALGAGISIATGASHVLQLMAGGGAYVRILRIKVKQGANTSAANASVCYFYAVRLSSAGTGGSAVTPRPFDTADTAGATAMTLPSSKGTETFELLRDSLIIRKAVLDTTAQAEDRWEWIAHPRGKGIIIPAGVANGIAIVNGSGLASATVAVEIEFTETAWL